MNYDDIVNLPHFKAPGHKQMSMHDRAAQFMPFKSLKGYDEMVQTKADESADVKWEDIVYEDSNCESDLL